MIAVRAATPADFEVLSRLLAAAFLHGDLAPWLIADVATRRRVYLPYFALHAEHALRFGHVDLAGGECAAALWYLIDGRPPPDLPGYDRRLAEITGPHVARFRALDAAMHAYHPYRERHHYLAFLAVRPDRQRRGLGSALLAHHHSGLDAAATPAYLEATGPDNARLYARHGYRPRAEYRIMGDGPVLMPQWRTPAPTGCPSPSVGPSR
ncbi:GNAT family N-acetyltransferase [Mangrovihabitans endophyticus]|uniref:N-acetyltransferase n=1 Tax=Mangrovihabitans endophyticus TaxID=1751298 RepID=A0A8J3C5N2_9ACTN|nr:GNAT family N-acetyltransferase [Mangrovihabitans endophyticus]GGL13069.1 N-acetyltransferase [Mangrovihabitans endophyticus]